MLAELFTQAFTWVKETVFGERCRKRHYPGVGSYSRGRDGSASPSRKRTKHHHHRRHHDSDSSGGERPLPIRVTPPPATSSASQQTAAVPPPTPATSSQPPVEDDFSFPPVPEPSKAKMPEGMKEFIKSNMGMTLPTLDDYIKSYNKPYKRTEKEIRTQEVLDTGIMNLPRRPKPQARRDSRYFVCTSMMPSKPTARQERQASKAKLAEEPEVTSPPSSTKRVAPIRLESRSEKKQRMTLIKEWEEVLKKSRQETERYKAKQTQKEASQKEPVLEHVTPNHSALYRPARTAPLYQPPDSIPSAKQLPKMRPFSDVKLSNVTLRSMSTYLGKQLEIGQDLSVEKGVPAFRPDMLTDEDRLKYNNMDRAFQHNVCFMLDNCEFTHRDINTLRPGGWLNDNVINGYMKLLQLRDGSLEEAPSCHFCKSFLVSNIFPDYNYPNVRRWTTERRLKNWGQQNKCILSCDFIFFPVHVHNNHWILIVADLNRKVIRYYDSLSAGPSSSYPDSCQEKLLENIRQYLVDEAKDKLHETWSETDFRFEIAQEMPQQQNGSDCGVFATRTAKELSGGNSLNFTAQNMDEYRILILKELSIGQLL